ncbi:MAG: helix-turn-helix transcriptional regulator [Nocardioidaceae bacterium]
MAAANETFSVFLDTLVASLGDPNLDGAELAARIHVSRFHLDRILTATAGEPPARLRRRILLERAAYRLATTEWGLLEVAAEAGYSSNEAFTRAFQRAFGAAPSTWRRGPTSILVDAPSGVHFHPPAGLRVRARTEGPSMDLVTTMVDHHLHVVGQLIDSAASLRDDQLDGPIELSVQGIDTDPSVRSLLSRLVGQLHMWNCAVENRPYDFALEHHEGWTPCGAAWRSTGPPSESGLARWWRQVGSRTPSWMRRGTVRRCSPTARWLRMC